MNSPKCFISYSWDSDLHKNWVRLLAEQLQDNGVFTYLDQWDVSPGTDLTKYMEESIRKSDYVLLICTPTFAAKANLGKGGVGYEKTIVTGEIFTESAPETKFVAILKEGNPKESLPSYLKAKAYIDFRIKDNFDHRLEDLLRHLHKSPRFVRPKLKGKPKFDDSISVQKNASVSPIQSDLTHKTKTFSSFKELYYFAFRELNKTTQDAERWARENQNLDIKKFTELFYFAFRELNKTTQDALKWAYDNMTN
jgi:hypothetical protein